MYRSFTDRVLGGVCGGLGALFPVNAWAFRIAFVVLSLITTGATALLYVMLWLLVPQRSPVRRQRGGSGLLLVTLLLTVAVLAGWWIWWNGGLRGPDGEPVYWAGLLVLTGVIYFMRQLRG